MTQDANDVSTDPVVACELKQHTKKELFRFAKRVFEYLVEHFKDNTRVPKLSEIKCMLGEEDGKHDQRACDSQYFNNSNICQATQFNRIGNIVNGELRSVNYCWQSAMKMSLLSNAGISKQCRSFKGVKHLATDD